MMVTDLRCWRQNHYVGDFFRYVGGCIKLVTSILNGHQHILSRTPVTNISATYLCHQDDDVTNIAVADFLIFQK